jgi:hypothetical protein
MKVKVTQVTGEEARQLGSEQWYRIVGGCMPENPADARLRIADQEKKLAQMRRAYELYHGVKL